MIYKANAFLLHLNHSFQTILSIKDGDLRFNLLAENQINSPEDNAIYTGRGGAV